MCVLLLRFAFRLCRLSSFRLTREGEEKVFLAQRDDRREVGVWYGKRTYSTLLKSPYITPPRPRYPHPHYPLFHSAKGL
jgi:hypothetical protein